MKALVQKIKQYFKSVTVWFSTVGIPMALFALNYAQTNLLIVKDNLGMSYGIVAFVLGFLGVAIRSRTTIPLSQK